MCHALRCLVGAAAAAAVVLDVWVSAAADIDRRDILFAGNVGSRLCCLLGQGQACLCARAWSCMMVCNSLCCVIAGTKIEVYAPRNKSKSRSDHDQVCGFVVFLAILGESISLQHKSILS
jgi:hypothetical protein